MTFPRLAGLVSRAIVCGLLLGTLSVRAEQGIGDGGGGSVITANPGSNEPPVLLDSFDLPTFDSARFRTPGTLLKKRKIELDHSVTETLDVQSSDAFQLAKARLSKWREASHSPALVSMVEEALDRMPYYSVKTGFKVQDQYDLSESTRKKFPNAKIETAILYLPQYGAIISEPVWNRTDRETQAGLFIHEALRQLQIAWGFGLDNRKLQKLTDALLRGPATSNETLETEEWLGPKLFAHLSGESQALKQILNYKIGICGGKTSLSEFSKSDGQFVNEESVGCRTAPQSECKLIGSVLQISEKLHQMPHSDFSLDRLMALTEEACRTGPPAPDWLDRLDIELMRCLVSPRLKPRQTQVCDKMYRGEPRDATIQMKAAKLSRLDRQIKDLEQRMKGAAYYALMTLDARLKQNPGRSVTEILQGMAPTERNRVLDGIKELRGFQERLIREAILVPSHD